MYPTHCNDNIITITPEGNFQTCPTANTVQKMKYNSTISKVCKEMESHLGFSEKTIAEV